MFRMVLPPIIRSAYSCIYSIWYLSHRYCYLPLSWKSWNRFECAVSGVHPKHVEQFPDINKLCNDASCWIYFGILLGAHYILHISRIRVNEAWVLKKIRLSAQLLALPFDQQSKCARDNEHISKHSCDKPRSAMLAQCRKTKWHIHE
jgi:hypothetical protein